jgi:hypothetical protein
MSTQHTQARAAIAKAIEETQEENGGPAFPSHGSMGEVAYEGMTLRQYAAIKLKVPESGTDWLDDMIRKSLRNDLAAKAMQGIAGNLQQVLGADGRRTILDILAIVQLNADLAYLQADEMMHLRYKLNDAYDCKENRHPKIVMKELGITYHHAMLNSMGDQWWFWNCKGIPDELPKYLEPMDLNKCIGLGLSKEDADKIEAGSKADVQEPYAWVYVNKYGVDSVPAAKEWCDAMVFGYGGSIFPLYTKPPTPAQRQWVGLTDYEIGVCSTEAAMNRSEMVGGAVTFARAVEQRLKEKNT